MSNTRLTVVVRRDLQLVPGLLAAQVAHMADAFMRERVVKAMESKEKSSYDIFSEEEIDWMEKPYLSVLAVNTLEELNLVLKQAQENELPIHLWWDVIPSHIFEGQFLECKVGLSIGPDDFDKIKIVTGMLPLY